MKRERRSASICACGSTAFVKSTRGRTALVDASDLGVLAQWQWSSSSLGHIYRRAPKSSGAKCVFLHHMMLPRLAGFEVDHINGDPCDNRRSNLRQATKAQNQWNRKAVVSISGFKGVTKNWSRWSASISKRVDGKRIRIYLGTHDTREQAARAYDIAAMSLFGAFARTNGMDLSRKIYP